MHSRAFVWRRRVFLALEVAFLWAFLFAERTRGVAAEAQVLGGAASFYLGSVLDGAGGETVFTTPDLWPECPPDPPCCPRHVDESGGRPRGSGEVIPSPNSTLGNYVADFYYYVDRTPRSHGRIGFRMPLEDADKNGMPDVIQTGLGFEGDVSCSLSWTSGELPASAALCRFRREKLSSRGSFAMDLPVGAMQRSWKGIWSLYALGGSIRYSMSTLNRAELQLRFVAPDGTIQSFAGNLGMQLQPDGQVLLDSSFLPGAGNAGLQIEQWILKHQPGSGDFIGTLRVRLPRVLNSAGDVRTQGCPDFLYPQSAFGQFILIVKDGNDTNGDGVPDILNALPPAPTLPVFRLNPEPAFARPGEQVSMRVQVAGEDPIFLQWYRGELPIEGAVGPNLTLRSVTAKDAGDYHVTAENIYGRVTSKAARLFVSRPAPEPKITQELQPLTISLGSKATFKVVSDGEPELGYQWFKDGQRVGGAALSELNLATTVVADIGDYSVVVSNRFGMVTSGPVALVIQGYPPRPSMRALRLTSRGPEIDCGVKPGLKYRLETSVDAVQWTALNLFTATNSVQTVKHSFATAQPGRFYRVVALGP